MASEPRIAGFSATAFGIPVITSPHVPTTEEVGEPSYRRPLLARLLHGRTVDMTYREVSCEHVYMLRLNGRNQVVMAPETMALLKLGGTDG